jgi:hypothetical protein
VSRCLFTWPVRLCIIRGLTTNHHHAFNPDFINHGSSGTTCATCFYSPAMNPGHPARVIGRVSWQTRLRFTPRVHLHTLPCFYRSAGGHPPAHSRLKAPADVFGVESLHTLPDSIFEHLSRVTSFLTARKPRYGSSSSRLAVVPTSSNSETYKRTG